MYILLLLVQCQIVPTSEINLSAVVMLNSYVPLSLVVASPIMKALEKLHDSTENRLF